MSHPTKKAIRLETSDPTDNPPKEGDCGYTTLAEIFGGIFDKTEWPPEFKDPTDK